MKPTQNVERLHVMHTSTVRPHSLFNADEIWPMHSHKEIPAFDEEMMKQLSERYNWDLTSAQKKRAFGLTEAIEITDLRCKVIWRNQKFHQLLGFKTGTARQEISLISNLLKMDVFSSKHFAHTQLVEYATQDKHQRPMRIRAEINLIFNNRLQASHLMIFHRAILTD